MQATRQWLFVFILAASLMGLGPVQPTSANHAAPQVESAARPEPVLQANLLELTGPTACPSGGCAGGQRLGMRFEFDLSSSNYDASKTPNIKVCVYATSAWAVDPAFVDVDANSDISSTTAYTIPADPGCPQDGSRPNGYDLIAERVATLPQNTPSDALRFAFRLGLGSSGNGRVIARLFAQTSSGWAAAPVASANSPILGMSQPPTANPAYVANDGTACGVYSPCYINSDGDKDKGYGTGLKDAVDAQPENSTVFIIGKYTIKANSVLIEKKLTLTGVGDATITYTGSASTCSEAMIALDETVTLRGLNIEDGNCTSPNRSLVEVNSQTGRTGNNDIVTIESNDLSGGDNAIFVRSDNSDPILIRFNQISSNSGHAIFFEGSGTSPAEIIANNITGNQFPINCAANASAPVTSRKANHNYWGASAPGQDATHCVIAAAKRLGMPITHNPSSPGVNADQVLVTTTKTYATRFDNQLAFNRTGGSDFWLYVIDHGYMTSGGPPFSQSGESPSPCSNYWDVFLADGAPAPTSLEMYVKYYNKENQTPGCLAVINSSLYCDQTSSPGKYPLFWLDPSSGSVTDWWDPVGARPENMTSGDGQTTTCNLNANEIQVSIDATGRPALSDLGYTPFMVGIPVIKYFTPLASNQVVTVTWGTNNEPDIKGFNILRGTDPNNLTQINGDLITHLGSSTTGSSYSRTDSGRVNGTTYYYRLQVVRTDDYSFYSAIVPITVNAATPTSPPPTWTPSPIRPTSTPPFTPVPTRLPTHTPTKSPIPYKTSTPSPTSLVLPTLTPTINLETPGANDTLTAIAILAQSGERENTVTPSPETGTPGATQIQGTEVALLGSGTPGLLATPDVLAEEGTKTNPWLSLLLGLLAGLIVVGGVGRWWYSTIK